MSCKFTHVINVEDESRENAASFLDVQRAEEKKAYM